MKNPLVYISILNWNSYSKTIKCVEALSILNYENYKLIIVDNASTDGSCAYIQQRFPEIKFIQSPTNLGYAGGNQLALEHAIQDGAEVFWILNNDIIVNSDTLTQMISAYNIKKDALYGSVPVYPDSQRGEKLVAFSPGMLKQGYKQKLITRRRSIYYRDMFSDLLPREVSALSGSSLLIPIHIVEKYEFMDTTFFLYAEETDYCYRLRQQHGIPSVIIPLSIVQHERHGSSEVHQSLKGVIKYYQTRNLLIWTRKYQSSTEYWMVLIKSLIRATIWFSATTLHGKSALQIADFMWRGVIDAIRNRTGKTFAPEDYLD